MSQSLPSNEPEQTSAADSTRPSTVTSAPIAPPVHVIPPYSLPLRVFSTSPLTPTFTAVAVFTELLRIIMERNVATPDLPLPEAPKPKTTDLPEIDDPVASGSGSAGPPVINEDTDLASLTPAQLYDLNLSALQSSTTTDQPLIASVAPIEVLRAEYENGSPAFVKQIDYLKSLGYRGIRRTRGDGDCFYRSLAFAYIERIMQSQDPSLAVMMAISTLDSMLPMLDAAGFQKMVYEDFYEVLISILKRIEPHMPMRLTPETLLEAFQDPEVSNYIVVFLRLLTSAQIRMDPEAFEAFLFHPELGEPMKTRDFCEVFVEAVGREADHVQMTALARAMKINLKVAYLDGHDAGGKVDFVEFSSAIDETAEPLVLLYRPGHYDILDKTDMEGLAL